MTHNTVAFKIKDNADKSVHSIEFYRVYQDENNEDKIAYIDSFSPMSKMELHTLKNFLQEYLHNNDDWD